MRLRKTSAAGTAAALVASVCLLAVFIFLPGCQRGESEPVDEGTALLKEMKAWFEATDYQASGYPGLAEALDDIYQDDGYTSTLYRDIGAVLGKSAPEGTTVPSVLKECQEWFELIDYEMSGYDSLEEAIEDIYQDGGETLDLYKKIATCNAGVK